MCTLQYHTATKDTHEVGTLQRIQQTSGIDGTETCQFPIGLLFFGHSVIVLRRYPFVLGNRSAKRRRGVPVRTIILQLEVGTFTVGQFKVIFIRYVIRHTIVVGTIVGNIQLAIAIYEGQVTVAVETTDMLCADGDEVAVENVVKCSRGVTIDGDGIGIHLVGTG